MKPQNDGDHITIATISAADKAFLLSTIEWIAEEANQFSVVWSSHNKCWEVSYPMTPKMPEAPIPLL